MPDPEFAFQVYTTIPLDSDEFGFLCGYLDQGIDFKPGPSYEIYSVPQLDAFTAVEHQRREIAYRKNVRPAVEGVFPGIAKVNARAIDKEGLLLLITTHSYRDWNSRRPDEDQAGIQWVAFNRNVPQTPSVPLVPDDPYFTHELYPEWNEIEVINCNDMRAMGHDLKMVYYDEQWDYGLGEDEGQPCPSDSPISAETLTLLDQKANSLSPDRYTTITEIDGSVTIMSNMHAASEPDLRYIVHLKFSHSVPDFIRMAQAFTSALVANLPDQRSIHLNFRQSSTSGLASLGSVVDSHRALVASQPCLGIGAMQTIRLKQDRSTVRMRTFPNSRTEQEGAIVFSQGCKTFLVILDRPDFLTVPGVLFLQADMDKRDEDDTWFGFRNTDLYQVWRCLTMEWVARRLAMLSLEEYPPKTQTPETELAMLSLEESGALTQPLDTE
ncbi:uncharacterized protein BO66DRAFT_317490 [Aspergillus aculeatinus CBS 121060]|uniref:Uncharacterized protein n=1 Tax=Aspergillus aculeatinus CBS 121060 TaxID=1448322 RepID=A0ACD1HGC1_9EURO|nr:hypothetical protein BO66DRAFT_317490 [Aspergillus aculeatinus CBS 121060]RAH72480.1 hypothetical protein BO66DRAFT_317490 [Aspergillus aculeatinus CBS 121060]